MMKSFPLPAEIMDKIRWERWNALEMFQRRLEDFVARCFFWMNETAEESWRAVTNFTGVLSLILD